MGINPFLIVGTDIRHRSFEGHTHNRNRNTNTKEREERGEREEEGERARATEARQTQKDALGGGEDQEHA